MPNENHHSEGAAGKAAYHRQHCSDGMLSHQGEFSWAIPRQDPTTLTNVLRHLITLANLLRHPFIFSHHYARFSFYAIAPAVCFCAATIASAMKVATRLTNFSLLLLGV